MRDKRSVDQDGNGTHSEKCAHSGPICKGEVTEFPEWVDAFSTC